jgi:hypothetical protein
MTNGPTSTTLVSGEGMEAIRAPKAPATLEEDLKR